MSPRRNDFVEPGFVEDYYFAGGYPSSRLRCVAVARERRIVGVPPERRVVAVQPGVS